MIFVRSESVRLQLNLCMTTCMRCLPDNLSNILSFLLGKSPHIREHLNIFILTKRVYRQLMFILGGYEQFGVVSIGDRAYLKMCQLENAILELGFMLFYINYLLLDITITGI